MSAPPSLLARIVRLRELQDQIDAALTERDEIIRTAPEDVGTRELARLLGVSATHVSRVRNGKD